MGALDDQGGTVFVHENIFIVHDPVAVGVLQFQVTVIGPNSNPLPASRVTVAWSGPALPDIAPEQAVKTTQCDTDGGGACTVTLGTDDLPVRRPITAVVTNVEHPVFDYDIAADVAEKTATFR